MKRNSITNQIAVAAGLLALSMAPGIIRAQDSAQPPAQEQSQTVPTTRAAREGRMHGAMQGLNLTDDQKTAIRKIRESTKSQVEAIKQNESLTADQKEAKIHQVRRGERMETVKLLTPEQREQMRANMRTRRAARREQQRQPQTPPQS